MPYPQGGQQDDTREIDESRFRAIQVEQDYSAPAQAPVEDDDEIIDIGAVPPRNTQGAGPQASQRGADVNGRRQVTQDERLGYASAAASGSGYGDHSSRGSQAGRAEDAVRTRQAGRSEGDDGSRRADRFEERDFGVEDLPPMPIIQKVILFVAILAIVFIGYKLVCYWIGI